MPFGEKIFPANRTNLDSLPNSPGVFTLYKDGELIFIGYADGASNTIKSRIMDHKEGREVPLTQQFDHYTREVTPNVVVRYRELMHQYAHKHHRWPKSPRPKALRRRRRSTHGIPRSANARLDSSRIWMPNWVIRSVRRRCCRHSSMNLPSSRVSLEWDCAAGLSGPSQPWLPFSLVSIVGATAFEHRERPRPERTWNRYSIASGPSSGGAIIWWAAVSVWRT